jgi:CelD/BcsL family acetyltransferase involved in cellulose biosynthesis
VDTYSTQGRRRDRLIAHVYAADGRHVQVALYGWEVVSKGGRRVATWDAAVYADTEEPLMPADEDRWRDDLVAAVFTRAAE